jgi:RNA polymerase sigma-70 factor (ECF subfamily)
LDEREQSVFILTVYEELPQKEIAEVLDLSVSNVKVILHRGRKKLMVELRDYFEE